MSRYNDYDSFAEVYNRHWGGFAHRVLATLDRLGLSALQPGDHVVDVCCGTGQLAAALTNRRLRVTGVDGSEEMIRVARGNAPDATFVAADVRRFTLESKAHMAVSTFDSLNHILDLPGLEQVFKCVAAALEPGARFVFDLNTDETFRANWDGTFVIDEHPDLVIALSAYDPVERLASVNLTMLTRTGDLWRRSDLELTQRAYATNEVEEALRRAGFGTIDTLDASDVMDNGQPGRLFVVAVRGD